MRRGEAAFLAMAVAAVGGFLILDAAVPRAPARKPAPPAGRFLSSGWYCPLPPDEGFNSLTSTTNLGDDPVHLRRWTVGGSRQSALKEGEVGPRRRSVGPVGEFGLPGAAAVVEVFGAASTSDSVTFSAEAGVAASRCSVQPADRWFFSVASTARGENTYLLVANPFEEEAVVKVRLMTAETDVVPARLKDVVIPQLSQGVIFLSEYYPETKGFALDVKATRGRVVVARYSRTSTRDGWRGIYSDVGIREPSLRWYFAGGEVANQGDEFIVLANPSEREALVGLIVQTKDEQLALPALAELAVPAGRQVTVRMGEHLPRGLQHGTSIASTNGVPIVAERQTFGSLAGGRGVDSVFGVPATGKRWVLSVGSPAGGSDSLAIVNYGRFPAIVRVALITEGGESRPPELAALTVEPGRRATVDVTPFLGGGAATAVVEALSGEVAVERHLWLEAVRDFADSFAQALE